MSSLADFYYLLALLFFDKDLNKMNLIQRTEVISQTQKRLTEELKEIILSLPENTTDESKKMAMCLIAAKKVRDHSIFKRFPEMEISIQKAYQKFLI